MLLFKNYYHSKVYKNFVRSEENQFDTASCITDHRCDDDGRKNVFNLQW